MDLGWQSNVSTFKYAIQVGHNFPSKEQASFNFMAAVTICSDFGTQKIKSATVSTASPSISHEVMGPDAMILVFTWDLEFISFKWVQIVCVCACVVHVGRGHTDHSEELSFWNINFPSEFRDKVCWFFLLNRLEWNTKITLIFKIKTNYFKKCHIYECVPLSSAPEVTIYSHFY